MTISSQSLLLGGVNVTSTSIAEFPCLRIRTSSESKATSLGSLSARESLATTNAGAISVPCHSRRTPFPRGRSFPLLKGTEKRVGVFITYQMRHLVEL